MSFHSLLVSGKDTPELLSRCRERLGDLRGRYNLGVIYLSDSLSADVAGIVEALRLHTGVENWAGGSAIGVLGIDGECFDQPSVSILLADLPEGSFRCFGPLSSMSEDPELARWREQAMPYLGLVHADPRYPQVPELIRTASAGGSTFLVGGLLSTRGEYVQVGQRIGQGALSGVLLSAAQPASTRLSQGCSPIGPRRIMTRTQGTRLLELDGRPALEVLAADLQTQGGEATGVHVALPRRGSDTGDYLVRNLMGVDNECNALVVGEQLMEGDALLFCRRDAVAARHDLERMLDELAGAVQAPVRGGIYVSCLARGPNLFTQPALEVSLIRERFGDIALAGFYANGEIAGEDLYGYTGVLTVFT